MGFSAGAALVYGIDMGDALEFRMTPEDEEMDSDDYLILLFGGPRRSTAEIGSPAWRRQDKKRDKFLAELPVALESYGHYDYGQWAITLRSVTNRGGDGIGAQLPRHRASGWTAHIIGPTLPIDPFVSQVNEFRKAVNRIVGAQAHACEIPLEAWIAGNWKSGELPEPGWMLLPSYG